MHIIKFSKQYSILGYKFENKNKDNSPMQVNIK